MEENYIWPEITKDTDPMDVIKIHEAIWDHVVRHCKMPHTPYIFDNVLCKYRDVTNSNVCLCGINCTFVTDDCLYGMHTNWKRSIDTFRYTGDTDALECAISYGIKIRDFFKNGLHVKNTFTKMGRELNNKIGGKNDGN